MSFCLKSSKQEEKKGNRELQFLPCRVVSDVNQQSVTTLQLAYLQLKKFQP